MRKSNIFIIIKISFVLEQNDGLFIFEFDLEIYLNFLVLLRLNVLTFSYTNV